MRTVSKLAYNDLIALQHLRGQCKITMASKSERHNRRQTQDNIYVDQSLQAVSRTTELDAPAHESSKLAKTRHVPTTGRVRRHRKPISQTCDDQVEDNVNEAQRSAALHRFRGPIL